MAVSIWALRTGALTCPDAVTALPVGMAAPYAGRLLQVSTGHGSGSEGTSPRTRALRLPRNYAHS